MKQTSKMTRNPVVFDGPYQDRSIAKNDSRANLPRKSFKSQLKMQEESGSKSFDPNDDFEPQPAIYVPSPQKKIPT